MKGLLLVGLRQFPLPLRSREGDVDGNNKSGKVKSAAAILAQKRVYQKLLRTLQQSSMARDVLQSKWPPFQMI